MFRLVKVAPDGGVSLPTISPKSAVKQDRESALKLYQQLGEALNKKDKPVQLFFEGFS